MPSSLGMGFSPYMKLMLRRANPERETADWRAVCGRTACTVWRAGRTSVLPDPYLRHTPDAEHRGTQGVWGVSAGSPKLGRRIYAEDNPRF